MTWFDWLLIVIFLGSCVRNVVELSEATTAKEGSVTTLAFLVDIAIIAGIFAGFA